MKKSILLLSAILILAATCINAQVTNNLELPTSINEDGTVPDASAILDVQSTTKGVLIPRMGTIQKAAIVSPAKGLLVFDTIQNMLCAFDGTAWQTIGLPSGGEWKDFLQIDVEGNPVWQPLLDPSNIPDPTPEDAGEIEAFGVSLALSVQGNYAYLVDRTNDSLIVVDVSNPAMPAIVGGVVIGDDPFGVDVMGNYAYVVNIGSDDLVVVDISDPTNPNVVGKEEVGGNPYSVTVEGYFAYIPNTVTRQLQIVDISVPTDPMLIGAYTFASGSVPLRVAIRDNFAFVVDNGHDELATIDVSNPAVPAQASFLSVGGTVPRGVAVKGDYVFITESDSDSLVVVNASDPFNPFIVDKGGLGDQAQNVAVQGCFAYTVDHGSNELKIFDISNPEEITLSASHYIYFDPYFVEVQDNYAYVILNSTGKLEIIKLADVQPLGVNMNGMVTSYNSPDDDPTNELNTGAMLNGDTLEITDGGGTIKVRMNGVTANSMEDEDGDTKIQVEEGPDDNIIRFDIAGTEFGRMDGKTFHINSSNNNLSIGQFAGSSITTGLNSTYIGQFAGSSMESGSYNTFIGRSAGASMTSSTFNTFIGLEAGQNKDGGSYNTLIGRQAGRNGGSGSSNIFIGNEAGLNANGSSNIFIGRNAGADETGSNLLYIDNSDTATPLIWGDFSSDIVRVNGRLETTQGFADADNDTKIQVEEGADEDVIRMDLEGSERLVIRKNNATGNHTMIELPNNNQNTFLGVNAGLDGTTGHDNTFMGSHAGKSTNSGRQNTFIGRSAGLSNTGGIGNTYVGKSAGEEASGDGNAFFGFLTGKKNTGGQNSFYGESAGENHEGGNGNTFIGQEAGRNNISGSANVFLGRSAGENETGSNKLYIDNSDTATPLIWGDFSSDIVRVNGRLEATQGFADADNDTKIQVEEGADDDIIRFDIEGDESIVIKKNNATGNHVMIDLPNNDANTFLGRNAGRDMTTGSINTFIGNGSGENLELGINNTFLGAFSGLNIEHGGENVFLGSNAGKKHQSGNANVYIGSEAGANNIGGSGNVFIGRSAGFNETGSNLLYIDDTDTATPLIWGSFSSNLVGINHVATTNALEVGGDASKTTAGDWLANSDARLKKNIRSLDSEDILQKMLSLQGITYEWDDDKTGNDRPEGTMYGFTAQNIQEIFPELVSEDNLGFLQTAYGTYDAMYVEAIRALNNEINTQKTEIENLQAQLSEMEQLKAESNLMKDRMAKLEAALLGTADKNVGED